MLFWWPLLVIAFICKIVIRFFRVILPRGVPSIHVDAPNVLDDRNQTNENTEIYMPSRRQTDKVQCYEPATMKYLGYFPALKPDEVKQRVAHAREAQKIWAQSSFKQRRWFLRILLKYIIEHQDLICEISARDTGKTILDAALGEIMKTCEKISWLLSKGESSLKPKYRSCGRAMFLRKDKVEFHPIGVIGAIVSSKYPFFNIFNPMLAAVFSGNSIVIKVSEHASWSGCFYLRIVKAALAAVGAPEYLVEVITGFTETGEALVSSVDKIIFVGSPAVGRMIMRNAADTFIPVTLELCGKDAFIVCEDVDVPYVAEIAVRGALQSGAQNCAGAERFYIHKDIYSAFVAEVLKIMKSITAGAICIQEHSEKLRSLVHDALQKGAVVAGEGSVGNIDEEAVDQYFPPIVIINVNHTMKLMQDEALGPIMPIMEFSYDEEAVELANDSKYGRGCAVFSGNRRRVEKIFSQICSEFTAVTNLASGYMCQSPPSGGVMLRRFGRFSDREGLRSCCVVKSLVRDRWWFFIQTYVPKTSQYRVSASFLESLYGSCLWDNLRGLAILMKQITDQDVPRAIRRPD